MSVAIVSGIAGFRVVADHHKRPAASGARTLRRVVFWLKVRTRGKTTSQREEVLTSREC